MTVVRTAEGNRGVVVAGHPLAANAGRDVLADGGNATDAAVAAAMVLSVVCPYACTLGGDVFALAFDAASGKLSGLNGSGVAPAAATEKRYNAGIPRTGPLSISVPGMLAGLEDLLLHNGTRPLDSLMGTAIRLARDGFPAHTQMVQNTQGRSELLSKNTEAARLFLPGGTPHAEGEMVHQLELAETLQHITEMGTRAFYEGSLADALVTGVSAAGGLIDAGDLSRHETLWQESMGVEFAGHHVATMPPNSYGLTLLLQLLELEARGVADIDPTTAAFALAGLQSRRRAYTAADGLIGDPGVLEEKARQRLDQIIATGIPLPDGPKGAEARDLCTACVVTMDSSGNAVSLIQSISAPYGSGIVAPGTGILFNNRMPGFSTKPGHPNVVTPGRRPAHTLAPCMVLRDGFPVMSIGTPGTVGQTCILAQILVRILARSEDPAAAIAAPRWSVTLDGKPAVERHMQESLKVAIGEKESELKVMPIGWISFGSVKIAQRTENGFLGIADGRRVATPAAW